MEIQYEVKYKKNAKRLIIRPDYRGGLKITAPYGLSRDQIEKIISINKERLSYFVNKNKDSTYFLGNEYKILDNVWDLSNHRVLKKENYLIIFRSREEKVPYILDEWLKEQARNIIVERVKHYSVLMNVKVRSVKIKELTSIWGSCNWKNELSFNYLLIKTPLKEIDYVVVHELSHTKYLNHSKNFWNLVKKIIPDYKTREKWLKEKFPKLS